jgi:hypothetical protein
MRMGKSESQRQNSVTHISPLLIESGSSHMLLTLSYYMNNINLKSMKR